MFNKPPAKAAEAPQAAPIPADSSGQGPRRAQKAASLISGDVVIDGAISGEGELHIDGAVRGEVRVERLSLGESGRIEGAVVAQSVEVRGRVVGSITARQVRLYGAAHVEGDITHETLAMETGAWFEGRSLRFQREAETSPAAAPALPLKPKTVEPIAAEVIPLEAVSA
jgi:cytoskeletal protein CcmA (bactofilin family)